MLNKNLFTESRAYYFAIAVLFLLNVSILLPPFLIFAGFEQAGAALYNLHNYDHQWIYRSECIMKDSKGVYSYEDCIVQGKESDAKIFTLYTTNGDPRYTNISFSDYKQGQIGRNKAEKVERNGKIGYKFANDTRDYAIYIPWFLIMLVYPFVFGKNDTRKQAGIWFIFALIPMGIDGTSQLLAGIFNNSSYYWLSSFGLKESTNLIRWITGAIAGIAAGYYTVPILNKIGSGNKNTK
ncbi:MAG: DUF2085 domain-containing protein [Candidatus Micrarchaeota archaeon]